MVDPESSNLYGSTLSDSGSGAKKRGRPYKEIKPRGVRQRGVWTKTDATARQSSFLRLIALGYSYKEVSAELGISFNTVKTYLATLRIGVPKTLLPVIALRKGWITEDELNSRVDSFRTGNNEWLYTPSTEKSEVKPEVKPVEPTGDADVDADGDN